MAVNGKPTYNNRSAKMLVAQKHVSCAGDATGSLISFAEVAALSSGSVYDKPIIMKMEGIADDTFFSIFTDVSGTLVAGPFVANESTSFSFGGKNGFCSGEFNEGLYLSGTGPGTVTVMVDIASEFTASLA